MLFDTWPHFFLIGWKKNDSMHPVIDLLSFQHIPLTWWPIPRICLCSLCPSNCTTHDLWKACNFKLFQKKQTLNGHQIVHSPKWFVWSFRCFKWLECLHHCAAVAARPTSLGAAADAKSLRLGLRARCGGGPAVACDVAAVAEQLAKQELWLKRLWGSETSWNNSNLNTF